MNYRITKIMYLFDVFISSFRLGCPIFTLHPETTDEKKNLSVFHPKQIRTRELQGVVESRARGATWPKDFVITVEAYGVEDFRDSCCSLSAYVPSVA